MSKYSNEKQVLGALLRLQSDIEKQAKKRKEKTFDFPISLHQSLHMHPKSTLDEIRRNLQIKGVSQLNKSDLVDCLVEYIPDFLQNIVHVWSKNSFDFVTQVAKSGGYIKSNDVDIELLDYFHSHGSIYSGMHDGDEVIAFPSDLIDLFLKFDRDTQLKKHIAQNDEWVTLTRGLLHYYGVLTMDDLFGLLEKYSNQSIEHYRLLTVLMLADIAIVENNFFVDLDVEDFELVFHVQQSRPQVEFYPFTKKQILRAGKDDFVERNDKYLRLVTLLVDQFGIAKLEADGIVEEALYEIQNGASPNEIIHYFNHYIELPTKKSLEHFVQLTMEFITDTRLWILRGHSPNDVIIEERKHLRPLAKNTPNAATKSLGVMILVLAGVGRNIRSVAESK